MPLSSPLCAQGFDDGGEKASVFSCDLRDVLCPAVVRLLHGFGQGSVAGAVAQRAWQVATLPCGHV